MHDKTTIQTVGYLSDSAMHAEISALRGEISRLREERQGELADLRNQVQKLERQIGALISHGPVQPDEPTEAASVSAPYRDWIKSNRDLLKKYPNSFVAIDLDQGVLLATSDESEFVAKLKEMPDAQRERLLTIHTSVYV